MAHRPRGGGWMGRVTTEGNVPPSDHWFWDILFRNTLLGGRSLEWNLHGSLLSLGLLGHGEAGGGGAVRRRGIQEQVAEGTLSLASGRRPAVSRSCGGFLT